MNVKIELHKLNTPIEIEAASTYQKGDLFCVADLHKDTVYKFPIDSIFRVVEGYTSATR